MRLKYIKDAWLILGITLLILILLEIGITLFCYRKGYLQSSSSDIKIDPRSQAEVYYNIPWVKDYFKELGESFKTQWKSYVYWRREPFKGKYINIDDKGLRVTIGSNNIPSGFNSTYRIFMFGGSTLWGTGARDAYTIPSLLSKYLAKKGMNTEIANYGENGYVSTQEVIELLLQLQKENIPNVVIFYDGVNDIFSAYQHSIAGLPQNENNRVKEFNLTNTRNLDKFVGIVFHEKVRELSIVRSANYIRSQISSHLNEALLKEKEKINYPANLNEQVVKVYLNNMKIVTTLGKTYGFKTLFYWQPTIFTKTTLSNYEKGIVADKKDINKLFDATYSKIADQHFENARNGFHDISRMFESYEKPLYIDFCHISEYGNQMVAEKIADDVIAILD